VFDFELSGRLAECHVTGWSNSRIHSCVFFVSLKK